MAMHPALAVRVATITLAILLIFKALSGPPICTEDHDRVRRIRLHVGGRMGVRERERQHN